MALLSNQAYLMHKEAGSVDFTKLLDIISVPDIGGDVETLDVTSLSHRKRRNMNGIQGTSSLQFGAYYTPEICIMLEAMAKADLEKSNDNLDMYQIWFGNDGEKGKYEWEGRLVSYIPSYDINAAIPLTLTISDEGFLPIHPAVPNAVGTGQIGSISLG